MRQHAGSGGQAHQGLAAEETFPESAGPDGPGWPASCPCTAVASVSALPSAGVPAVPICLQWHLQHALMPDAGQHMSTLLPWAEIPAGNGARSLACL